MGALVVAYKAYKGIPWYAFRAPTSRPDILNMDDEVRAVLDYWKTHKLRSSDLLFGPTVLALREGRRLIEPRRSSPCEWTVSISSRM